MNRWNFEFFFYLCNLKWINYDDQYSIFKTLENNVCEKKCFSISKFKNLVPLVDNKLMNHMNIEKTEFLCNNVLKKVSKILLIAKTTEADLDSL